MKVVQRTLKGRAVTKERLLAEPITSERVARLVRRAERRA